MEKPNAVPLDLEAIEAEYKKITKMEISYLGRLCTLDDFFTKLFTRLRAPQPNAVREALALLNEATSPEIKRPDLHEEWTHADASNEKGYDHWLVERAIAILTAPQPNAGLREAIGREILKMWNEARGRTTRWEDYDPDDLELFLKDADRILALLPLGSGVQGEAEIRNPGLGRWRYSQGYLFCGTLRAMRDDWDTNPSEEFKKETMGWACQVLNKAGEEAEIRKDDGETLDPRYGKPHSVTIPKWDMHRAPWVEIGGMIYTVPSQVWEAMGQMLHHNIELKKKLNALREGK